MSCAIYSLACYDRSSTSTTVDISFSKCKPLVTKTVAKTPKTFLSYTQQKSCCALRKSTKGEGIGGSRDACFALRPASRRGCSGALDRLLLWKAPDLLVIKGDTMLHSAGTTTAFCAGGDSSHRPRPKDGRRAHPAHRALAYQPEVCHPVCHCKRIKEPIKSVFVVSLQSVFRSLLMRCAAAQGGADRRGISLAGQSLHHASAESSPSAGALTRASGGTRIPLIILV